MNLARNDIVHGKEKCSGKKRKVNGDNEVKHHDQHQAKQTQVS